MKTLRILSWLTKLLLLLIALSALIMWPISSGRSIGLALQRHTVHPESGHLRNYHLSCADEHIIFSRVWQHIPADMLPPAHRDKAQATNQRWQLALWYKIARWSEDQWPHRCGPVRWESANQTAPAKIVYRACAAPLWLIALAAGLWPAISLSLATRQRLLRRQRRTRGQCETCGYDLRATPDRCPECGHPANSRRSV